MRLGKQIVMRFGGLEKPVFHFSHIHKLFKEEKKMTKNKSTPSTVKVENKTIEVVFDENNQPWLSMQELCKLFGQSARTIKRVIDSRLSMPSKSPIFAEIEQEQFKINSIGRKRYYNLPIIELIGEEINKEALRHFTESMAKQLNNGYETINNLNIDKINNKSEIMTFIDNGFALDVNVSPLEETVWLTKEQIALLFERELSVITKHINNIYKENELERDGTCAKFAHMVMYGRTYYIEMFNLDIILSVGYRVNSKRGIAFRKWASSVLKDYLLRGYCTNDKRLSIIEQNYCSIRNEIGEIKEELADIKRKIEYTMPLELAFSDGEVFDAFDFFCNMTKKARESIVYIDPFADGSIFHVLKNKHPNVRVKIIKSSFTSLGKKGLDLFKRQYGEIDVVVDNTIHDRFMIIDNNVIYHIGTSINGAGNKTFLVHQIENKDIHKTLINKYGVQVQN